MYRRNALVAHARYVGVPLRADFALDVDAMLAAIERERPALVWLALSEQPDRQPVRRRATSSASSARRPASSSIDEAYYAFADASFLPRVLEFPNLVVVRTRVEDRHGRACGSAMRSAHPDWIDEFEKVRPPYNVNALTQAARAGAAGARRRASREQAAAIRSERDARRSARWRRFAGVHVVRDADEFRAGARARCRAHGFERCATRGSSSRTSTAGIRCSRNACASPSARRRRTTRCSPRSRRRIGAAIAHACDERQGTRMNAPLERPVRSAQVERDTAETSIRVRARHSTAPGAPSSRPALPFLDHMLDQVARHGMLDLDGRAPRATCTSTRTTRSRTSASRSARRSSEAIGDKKGIRRYGHAYVPLDEALSRVVIDLSGPSGPRVPRAVHARDDRRRSTSTSTHEFFQGFVNHALVTLHIDNLRGDNAHHQCETVFKAFARALRMAVRARSARRAARFRRPRARCNRSGIVGLVADARPACRTSPSSTTEWATCARWRRRSCTSRPSATIVVTADPAAIRARRRVVLPGQSAMPDCMAQPRRERPARRRVEACRATGRSSASASACRCCSTRARRGRRRVPRRAAGQRRALPRRGDGAAGRRAAQGAAHGLEPGAPGAAASAVGGHRRRRALLFRAQLLSRCPDDAALTVGDRRLSGGRLLAR